MPDAPGGLSPRNRLLLDLGTGYAATAARVGWWAVVSAVALRHRSAELFAALMVTRSAVTLFNYLANGLGPATLNALAHDDRQVFHAIPADQPADSAAAPTGDTLTYHRRSKVLTNRPPLPEFPTLAAAAGAAAIGALAIFILALFAAANVSTIFGNRTRAIAGTYALLIIAFSAAAAVRLAAEPLGALLQWRGRLYVDNAIQFIAECVAGGLAVFSLLNPRRDIDSVAAAAVYGALTLMLLRLLALPWREHFAELIGVFSRYRDRVWPLGRFALLIAIAQLADYLYGPTDYILINHLLSPADTVAYTPAVQIDSGLLLLVAAVGIAVLPRAAAAYARNDTRSLRQLYWRGTLACFAIMLISSAIILLIARPLLQIWYGQDVPGTRGILWLVLINTILGGASAAGRAILLAIGRTRAFAIAAIIAGIVNVIASIGFVKYLHLGLVGIVLGTVVAVVARCAIWMPWYVLRTLRRHPVPGPIPAQIGLSTPQ